MQHLDTQWRSLLQQIKERRRLLLISDFDGTLAPIVARPEEAAILPEVEPVLRRFAAVGGCVVALVSGRTLEDLRARVDVSGCFYAGNHGLEWSDPASPQSPPVLNESVATAMDRFRHAAEMAASEVPGAFVENKRYSVSIHFRLVAPERAPDLVSCIVRLAQFFRGELDLQIGRKVLEVRPSGTPDKGDITRRLLSLAEQRLGGVPVVLYFGDDAGDESAFRVLRRHGYTVQVGRLQTGSCAEFRLDSPYEVSRFLERLWGNVAPLMTGPPEAVCTQPSELPPAAPAR